MKSRFLIPVLLSLFAAVEVFGADSQLKLPPYSRVILSNGVTALLMEQHEVPIVSFSILTSAGSVEDPAGKEGLASLTAELLRRGTKSRSAEQIASELDFLGGLMDFDAGLDFSTGEAEFLAKDSAAGLALMADVLFQPAFPKEEVEKRVQQRIDEIKSLKDEPQSVLTNYFHAFLFDKHPYGRPIDGDEATNAKLNREEVARFYENHYLPQQMRIAVVGDFTVSEMTSLLQGTVGVPVRAGKTVPTPVPAPTTVRGKRLLLVDKPDATQSFYILGNVGIS